MHLLYLYNGISKEVYALSCCIIGIQSLNNFPTFIYVPTKMSFFIKFDRNLAVTAPVKYTNNSRLKKVNSDRRASTFKWIRSLITVYYLFIAYYGLFELDFTSISHPNWRNLKNHWWKCITVWNMVLQVRYFIMSFLIDHKDSLPKINLIHKYITMGKNVQDYCFIALDVPSSIFVCCLFWIIQTLNRPLFFPKEMSLWIPNWYNHAVHTYPFFVIFFQMFSHFHQNPPVKPAILGLCLHCSVYITCVLYTRWSTGQWIYLVIGEIVENIPQAVVLFLLTGFVFPLIILLMCYKLNDLIWLEKTN